MSEKRTDLMIPITATAIELYEGNALEAVIAKIEEKARAHKPDVTTKKGRDAIRSNAAKVTSSRTYLFQLGKDLTEERREGIKATNAVRNSMEERLKDLNEEVRKLLTEYEEAEKKREAIAIEAMDKIKELGNASLESTAEELETRLVELKGIKVDDSFGDHANVASIEKEKSVEKLESAIATVKRREAGQAELAKLQKEQEEREAAEKREANKKHQAKINNAVASGLIQVSGIKEADAKAIVTAIARGEIPHVSIQY